MYILTRAKRLAGAILFQATLPPVRRWLRSRWETDADVPPVGLVRFGSLRRLTPISRDCLWRASARPSGRWTMGSSRP